MTKNTSGRNTNQKFIGIEELAAYLDVAKGTIYGWIFLKKISYFKIGRLVKFDLKEVEEWLNSRKVEEIN